MTRIMRDDDGKIANSKGMAKNIAEERRIIESLRQSEEKYRLLVENANDIIVIVQKGIVAFANRKAVERTGYAYEQIVDRDFINFIHPDDRALVRKRYEDRIAGRSVPERYQFKLLRNDGAEIWGEISAVGITWEGEPATLNFIRDITEQKKIETQLQQSQKLEAIGTLAGGIAHDFNNLLMGIQGNASLMMLDLDENHPQYRMLKSIERHVQRGANLTRQLLDFSRGGKYEVRATNLNDFIHAIAEIWARTRKEVVLDERYCQNPWTVEVDRVQIEQVLLNLFVNAWQAMPGGGKLCIETANVALNDHDGEIHKVSPGRYVKTSIADTGMGMDEATMSRIFEPFFTTKEMGRGTGLGLAAAYGIVKNHGGFISVHSKKGQGSTFDVFLPASEEQMEPAAKAGEEITGGSEKILIIDDEESILAVGSELLRRIGYTALTASGGERALALYGERPDEIALIILDMIMPGMSGYQTFEALKKINPKVKVLLSSGCSRDGEASRILDRGCNGFIQKPFSLRELSSKVREIIDIGNL
ncbi:MAG: PAS domain S-box protein [Deltaproteobacteria bacterium]|nr:PAS domain S-box protein [Deltaproteobacteria bacterium]